MDIDQPRPTPPRHWFRIILRALILLILVIAFGGFLYENVSEARDQRFNPMTGQRFDVGGFKMHIDCMGQGRPTVIFDSGLGDTYLSWQKVQPEIAKLTRACSYDRAGLGYSDPSPRPRTSKVIAEELHSLLRAAKVDPPYVLVGHSMGGYDVRIFASLYRDEVGGMVLVDASHPDQENRFPRELKDMEGGWIREAEFLAYTTPFGLPRLFGFCDDDPVRRAAECNFHSAREGLDEFKSFRQSAAETAATGTLGPFPLAVLSHDPDKPSAEFPPDLARQVNAAWEKMQEELAHLSIYGTQTIAKNSGHYIQVDRPDIVVDAVRSVVQQEREWESKAILIRSGNAVPGEVAMPQANSPSQPH
jgi:pimeloyl-ACP methyl ester carboxylesterase